MIRLGWRKRVLEIDWSDTPVRGEVTSDEVTKADMMVHAWSYEKAIGYLGAWRKLAESSAASENLTPTPGEWAELCKAIGELAMAIGNPAVEAVGDQTIESETVREALRKVKETVAAVRRIRDAGIDVEAPL